MEAVQRTREPTRTCVGCMGREPKERLFRLVRGPDGVVTLDREGAAPGRGAWVHRRTACLVRAEAPRALGRAFRGKVKAPAPGALLEMVSAAGMRLDENVVPAAPTGSTTSTPKPSTRPSAASSSVVPVRPLP